MLFGERITQVRKHKNLSQAQMGKTLGIDGDAYGRYEHGEVKPSIEMATRIADVFEVSLIFLLVRLILNWIRPPSIALRR